MKRFLLILNILLLSFIAFRSVKPKEVSAQEKCTSAGLCLVSGSNCKSGGFDCSNHFTVNSKNECEVKGGCFESVTCTGQVVSTMYCYQESGQPQKTNTPFGQEEKLEIYCDSSNKPTTDAGSGKLYTAIGCIPVNNLESFISSILGWAIGIGGGVAFLLIVYSGFMIMTSSGDPERLKAGQELLNSAIAGLIMLIFSVFILRVIGVDILKIPGITTSTGMR